MTKRNQSGQTRNGCVRSALFATLLSASVISGCSTFPSSIERTKRADALMAAAGWYKQLIPAGNFMLVAYLPKTRSMSKTLTIYIEGDGAAWLNRSTPSSDPTPVRATGMELALHHRGGTAAYLARPCQFVANEDRRGCDVDYWTGKRFAPEVIDATAIAIDAMKKMVGAKRVILVGYSGGGAVATLVASERNDVERLVTVAGNLDHATWTQLHDVEPLTGSLNPADRWRQLINIPQVHFVGAQDKIMDKKVALSFRRSFPIERQPELVIVPGFDHQCCWARDWPQLFGQ